LKKLFFLVLLLVSGCGDSSPGKGPREVLFAYGNGDGIYVLNGDGSLKKEVIGGSYYQAVLSPDKTKIACVYDKDFQVTIFYLDGSFESQGKPKTVFNSQALSQGSKMTPVCCPVWSLDGQKIYFLNLNHLIAYDYQEKKTTSLFDFPDNQSGGQTDEKGNMKLSKDGGSLYCLLSEATGKLAIWTFNLRDNQAVPISSCDCDSLLQLRFPVEIPDDAVENLFGSRENPVLGPVYSSDHRYYFYSPKEQGFWAKQRIEGYDRTIKEKFDVVTLNTSIYSK